MDEVNPDEVIDQANEFVKKYYTPMLLIAGLGVGFWIGRGRQIPMSKGLDVLLSQRAYDAVLSQGGFYVEMKHGPDLVVGLKGIANAMQSEAAQAAAKTVWDAAQAAEAVA